MKALAVETAADLVGLPGYASVADRILFDARAPKGATRVLAKPVRLDNVIGVLEQYC